MSVRARRAGWARIAAVLAVAAGPAAVAVACNLAVGLDGFQFPDAGAPPPMCTSASQCDDKDPCTTDTCADGVCVHSPVQNGPAPIPMVPCQIATCDGGVEGVAYQSDVPCMQGSPDAGGAEGMCKQGVCNVTCSTQKPCPPSSNPCATSVCNPSGLCVASNLPDGTQPSDPEDAGSCHDVLCFSGSPMPVEDDTRLPATMGDCVFSTCDAGVGSYTPEKAGFPCATFMNTQAGYCDGAGHCVQCTSSSQCPSSSSDDDCQQPACVTNQCVPVFADAGTVTSNPPQVPDDCQQIVCDGDGGTTIVHSEAGTACGSGLTCTNTGACTGCMTGASCGLAQCSGNLLIKARSCVGAVCEPPVTQDCTPYVCAMGACLTKCTVTGDCSREDGGNYCDTDAGECVAKIGQGSPCGANGQCQTGFCVDGVCCDAPCGGPCIGCAGAYTGVADGICSALLPGVPPKTDVAQPCVDAGLCGHNGLCDGASCAYYPAGTVCAPASCNVSGFPVFAKTCNGTGSCVALGEPTGSCAPYLCVDGGCGTSCATDADCATLNYCFDGACLPQETSGQPCTAGDQCQSGTCAGGACK